MTDCNYIIQNTRMLETTQISNIQGTVKKKYAKEMNPYELKIQMYCTDTRKA